MLVEHGIDNMDKRLIAGKETVPPGQQITFQPSLTGVFAQDFHDASIDAQIGVGGDDFLIPRPAGHLEDRRQTVRFGFIWTENAEVRVRQVVSHHIAQECAQNAGRFRHRRSMRLDRDSIVTEVWHPQILEQ